MLRPRYHEQRAVEPLGILLLPCRLEDFELADHARDLLSIPARHARRLRFPGQPRVVVLYDPMQYPLARALLARHDAAELWYIGRDGVQSTDVPGCDHEELIELDQLARARARQTIGRGDDALRYRLRELEIISPRPFVPGARIQTR